MVGRGGPHVNSLIPHPTDFAHASRTHGQAHVGRVMIHAFRLIEATGHRDDAARLWGAVYLHDLARTHDGFCEVHGRDAVLRVSLIHISEPTRLLSISYAVFCLKKKKKER